MIKCLHGVMEIGYIVQLGTNILITKNSLLLETIEIQMDIFIGNGSKVGLCFESI